MASICALRMRKLSLMESQMLASITRYMITIGTSATGDATDSCTETAA